MLFATVRQRKIYVKAPQTVVKDGVNVDVLRLEMDDEWAEMTSIICVFSNGSVKKEVMHTFGHPITVPWECLESTGVLMLGITGYVGTQKVMTTMNADNGWEIVQNSETTGEEQFEATPTLTQQLLEAATSANNAAAAANTAKQDILDAVSNGEFDGAPGKDGADGQPGADGYSPSAKVTQTASGAEITITDKDGTTTATVMNGKDGADGVGIESVVQTTTSTEDGGTNVVTVTKTDGSSSTFTVKNGSKGSDGAPGADGEPGADGHTPVKGTDYFTDADKQEIAEAAAEMVSIPTQLPNPNALTFTGAAEASYDGSAPLTVEIPIGGGGSGGTSDHSKLSNRDAADQHPIGAITGLEAALAGKQSAGSYLTEESDPTVPAWAKTEKKPSYTAQEVGADPSGTAAGLVSSHNMAEAAHNDIRLLISGLTDRLNALADSDDTTLDQLSEVVAYIKANRELIASITTDKVSVTDIVNDLVTNVTNKPLSAAQGVALKALIDAITIPTALPNPNALTFTGAVTGSYDGSAPLSVEIPSGGGGETPIDTISEGTLSEDVANIVIDGFSKRTIALSVVPYGSTANSENIRISMKFELDSGDVLTCNPTLNFVTNTASVAWNKMVVFAFIENGIIEVTIYRDGGSISQDIIINNFTSTNTWIVKSVYIGAQKITSVTIGLQADGVIGKNTAYKVVGS